MSRWGRGCVPWGDLCVLLPADEALREFRRINHQGQRDFTEFVVEFLISDVINYLPKEAVCEDAAGGLDKEIPPCF